MSPLAFFRRLFCRHREFDFVRNIYGDEINHCGGRSWFSLNRRLLHMRRQLD